MYETNHLGIQSCPGDAFTSWDLRKQHHLKSNSRISRGYFCWSTTSAISVSRYVSLYRTPLSRITRYGGRFPGGVDLRLDSIVLRLTGIYNKSDTFDTPDQSGLMRHICIVIQQQCIHIVRSQDVNASPLYDYIPRWVEPCINMHFVFNPTLVARKHMGTSTRGHIYTWAHLHMGTSTHGHVYTWAQLHMGTSTHGHIYTWAHLHMATSTHGPSDVPLEGITVTLIFQWCLNLVALQQWFSSCMVVLSSGIPNCSQHLPATLARQNIKPLMLISASF